MAGSIHDKLERVRPPRVHIKYEVETGDAIEVKELPFVMGVLGDFTGQPKKDDPLKPFKERKFTEVTPDNFDKVLDAMNPHLALTVKNTESTDEKTANLQVDLNFHKLDDFDPDNVAKQVPALNRLLELRTKLNDLKGSLQGNDKLDALLQEVIADTEKMGKLQSEMAGGGQGGGSNE